MANERSGKVQTVFDVYSLISVNDAETQMRAATGVPVTNIMPGQRCKLSQCLMSGGAIKVLGCIDPSDLGVTLTHEHLCMKGDALLHPAPPGDEHRATAAIEMKNLGWIRQNSWCHKSNLQLDEEKDAVMEELRQFRLNGGRSMVENSTYGLSRTDEFLTDASKETGVHIIAGTGYYVDTAWPDDARQMSVEQLAGVMTRDLTGEGNLLCGAIGEIGCSWPLTANERRALQASASVQSQLGCPVIIHPGRYHDSPAEIIRILQEAGGDIAKTVMSHLDRTFFDKEQLLEFASMGSYLEYDLFGVEVSHYTLADVDMPSDAQRIQRIGWLVEGGYEDMVVIAHDLHTKHRLEKYGGHGYSHIFRSVVPKMLKRGISKDVVDKILVHNPKRWLTFK